VLSQVCHGGSVSACFQWETWGDWVAMV
jgi:hypothetical protein